MRLRRLRVFHYTGFHAYSLTLCTFERRPYFTDADLVRDVLVQILRAAAESTFDVPAYCFMPDHVHLLLCGNELTSHLPACMKLLRQRTAVDFSRTRRGERLWQVGYFEHVLRDDEGIETLEWPFTGGSYLRPVGHRS
jgi:putative transposase